MKFDRNPLLLEIRKRVALPVPSVINGKQLVIMECRNYQTFEAYQSTVS